MKQTCTFDKYKACKDLETGADCPDRKLGCHDTCEGYKFRCEKAKEIKDRLRALNGTLAPTEQRLKANINYYKKQKKSKIYRK